MVTLTWHACKYNIYKFHQRYLWQSLQTLYLLACQVPLVEFTYLVFTCMPGESYHRQPWWLQQGKQPWWLQQGKQPWWLQQGKQPWWLQRANNHDGYGRANNHDGYSRANNHDGYGRANNHDGYRGQTQNCFEVTVFAGDLPRGVTLYQDTKPK